MEKKCFIACPVGDNETETRRRADTVFEFLLKPICESLNYHTIRSDKIASTNRIDAEIIDLLDSSDLVIADLSDCNPNVFYEAGYRKAKGLPCIHIAIDGTKLPFDVTTIRTYFYSVSDLEKSEKFKVDLKEVITNVESRVNNDTNIKSSDDSDSIEQKILERIYNLEDSLESFYDMTNKGLMDVVDRINDCNSNSSSSNSQLEQMFVDSFFKEAMKNPVNARRLISLLQDLGNKSSS